MRTPRATLEESSNDRSASRALVQHSRMFFRNRRNLDVPFNVWERVAQVGRPCKPLQTPARLGSATTSSPASKELPERARLIYKTLSVQNVVDLKTSFESSRAFGTVRS